MCVCVRVRVWCVLSSACADGYLTPCIQRYVTGFAAGFKDPVSFSSLYFISFYLFIYCFIIIRESVEIVTAPKVSITTQNTSDFCIENWLQK